MFDAQDPHMISAHMLKIAIVFVFLLTRNFMRVIQVADALALVWNIQIQINVLVVNQYIN
jgi:hypothetical protein